MGVSDLLMVLPPPLEGLALHLLIASQDRVSPALQHIRGGNVPERIVVPPVVIEPPRSSLMAASRSDTTS